MISFSKQDLVCDRRDVICTISISFTASSYCVVWILLRKVHKTHQVDLDRSPSKGPTTLRHNIHDFGEAVARNSSWREVSVSPWCRSTRSAYSELEHLPSEELTRSAAVNLSFRTTPSAVILCTWLIIKQGGGSIAGLLCAPRPANIISLDFVQFNYRLLSSARIVVVVVVLYSPNNR